MPAKKPLSEHKIALSVTCSQKHKKQIDRALSHIPKGRKSREILKLLKDAIATKKTEIADDVGFWHNTKVQFQISCTRQEKELIDAFCKTHLTARKRSRWITKMIILTDQLQRKES